MTKSKKLIIAFDSTCLLCNRAVRLLAMIDPLKRFYFCILTADLKQKAPQIDSMLVFKSTLDTSPYHQSQAVKLLCQNSPFLWPLVPLFFVIPRLFLDILYQKLAKARYRYFGSTKHCVLEHIPSIKKKCYNKSR